MHEGVRVPAETRLPDRAVKARRGLTGTFDTASGPYPLRDQANALYTEPVVAAIGPAIDRAALSLEEDAHLTLLLMERGPARRRSWSRQTYLPGIFGDRPCRQRGGGSPSRGTT